MFFGKVMKRVESHNALAKQSSGKNVKSDVKSEDVTVSPSTSPPKNSLSGYFGSGKLLNKNKGFQETRKNFNEFEKKTKFSKEKLEKLATIFYSAYPDGFMTRTEFIRENQTQKGGSEELWSSVYQLMDANGDGSIDIQEFLLANSIAATGTLETKVGWMFSLFDEDKSNTLQDFEVKKFIDLLLKTNTNYLKTDGNSFTEKIYSILDDQKTGQVTIDDFIRVAKSNPQLADLINSYTNIIIYDVDFEQKKSGNVGTTDFEDQVAGHSGGIKSIIKKGKQIWKPLNQTEFEFYEELRSQNQDYLKVLKDFMVPYHGRTFVDYSDREDIGMILHYIIIDDLTFHMKKPCVIDLKMGTREYSDEDSTKKKVQKAVLSRVTASNQLGFRICGMKVWKEKEQQFGTQSKKKALLLSPQQVEESLLAFIDNGSMFNYNFYKSAIQQLETLLDWFENVNSMYCFYASSILLLYDGEGGKEGTVQVKMIDFAHTQKIKKGRKTIFGKQESGPRDDSYITGLKCLIEILKNIVDKKIVYKKGGKGILQMPEVDVINKQLQTQMSQIESILEKAKEKRDDKTIDKLKKDLQIKQEIIDEMTLELKYFNEDEGDPEKQLSSLKNDVSDSSELTQLQITKDLELQSLRDEIQFLKSTQSTESVPKDEKLERKLLEKDIMIAGLWKHIDKLEHDLEASRAHHNQRTLRFGTVLSLREEFAKLNEDHQRILLLKDMELKAKDDLIKKLSK